MESLAFFPFSKNRALSWNQRGLFGREWNAWQKKYLHSDDSCVKIASNLTECDVL